MINSSTSQNKSKFFSKTIMIALFTAFICVGSFIHIPLPGGVPVAIQDMMAMLAGLLLGPIYGGISVLLFLILGCVGLPVFTGKAGLHIITAGPTGGFLLGYFFGAIAGGFFLYSVLHFRKFEKNFFIVIATIATVISTIVIFAIGIVGFMRVVPGGVLKAFTVAVLPFIPGNILKIILATFLTVRFRPVIQNYLY